jgi:hypothetical protein
MKLTDMSEGVEAGIGVVGTWAKQMPEKKNDANIAPQRQIFIQPPKYYR